MTHTFLLEVGLEEMPAKVIQPSVEQIKEKTEAFLNEEKLSFDSIEMFSTPRRLAIKIKQLAEKQPNETSTVKGPAKRIAQDDEGNWSKAAIGFTKAQGASVEDIIFKEVKGEEYVFVEKHVQGKLAFEVLKDLPKVIASLTFPLSMKWGSSSYRFIRPVHWLVALLDDTIIPFELFEVHTGNKTQGHRFLGQEITLETAEEYEACLEKQFVLVDRNRRQQTIIDQIESLCREQHWKSPLENQKLLNEVTDLVEYPAVFYGAFDPTFLSVPESVLEISMADHQRYFPVRKDDRSAEFLPYFIGVRNGNKEYIDIVARGNEKVLTARLADAKFFYEEDQKLSIEDCVEKLKEITFQDQLGSLYDKQVRVEKIAALLAETFNLQEVEKSQLKRAANIYKFDLVTNTVVEFTKLQGQIGMIYALERGERKEVAEAIIQQYMPASTEGDVPYTRIGAVLSLADKLDTLLLFFALGMIPSGSNDPFALRRYAMGVVRILQKYEAELSFQFPLHTAVDEITSVMDVNVELEAGIKQNKEAFVDFIKDRVDQQLQRQELALSGKQKDESSRTHAASIPFDIRNAVLHGSQDDTLLIIDSAKTLMQAKEKEDYKNIVESLTRVTNLAEKAQENWSVDKTLFQTESEKALFAKTKETKAVFCNEVQGEKRYRALKELTPFIDTFFDENMVMTDDKKVRQNRLALLQIINHLTMMFANLSKLVIK